jgi:hypothetical protein
MREGARDVLARAHELEAAPFLVEGHHLRGQEILDGRGHVERGSEGGGGRGVAVRGGLRAEQAQLPVPEAAGGQALVAEGDTRHRHDGARVLSLHQRQERGESARPLERVRRRRLHRDRVEIRGHVLPVQGLEPRGVRGLEAARHHQGIGVRRAHLHRRELEEEGQLARGHAGPDRELVGAHATARLAGDLAQPRLPRFRLIRRGQRAEGEHDGHLARGIDGQPLVERGPARGALPSDFARRDGQADEHRHPGRGPRLIQRGGQHGLGVERLLDADAAQDRVVGAGGAGRRESKGQEKGEGHGRLVSPGRGN